jgi:mono/diheme cytochrome c family protein
MLKHFLVTAIAAMLAASMAYANQPTVKVTIPVGRTAPTDGKQMYASYCASCHGVDGKGQGPVASELRTRPANLTSLSRNNDGKYPGLHVMNVLQFGVAIPPHGTAQMPVWGPVFGKMDQADTLEEPLRVGNLTRYLQTLQTK